MKATWHFDDDEDGPTLRVKLGNGHEISVFYTIGGPPEPEITLNDPSGGFRFLEGNQVDVFRAWLAGAA